MVYRNMILLSRINSFIELGSEKSFIFLYNVKRSRVRRVLSYLTI
jgi:hypothetical protein